MDSKSIRNKYQIPDDVHFHYCSIETLFSILENKELWLTEAKYLNDTTDSKWLLRSWPQVSKRLSNLVDVQTLNQVQTLIDNEKRLPSVFCFSSNPDLLSQWRAYSSDGSGVSIGISIDAFQLRKEVPSADFIPYFDMGFCKMHYDWDLNSFINEIENIIDISRRDGQTNLNKYFIYGIVKKYALTLKHPAFEEEDESRFIYLADIAKHSLNWSRRYSIELDVPKYRVLRNRIIAYIPMKIDRLNNDIIKYVFLGPKCQMDVDDMNQFLDSKNLSFAEVIQSEAPYK